ncbi:MAG: hypothetical protein JTJ11_09635 [Collinsella sp.]|nr:hypothetical protein [Collinsella sp.]
MLKLKKSEFEAARGRIAFVQENLDAARQRGCAAGETVAEQSGGLWKVAAVNQAKAVDRQSILLGGALQTICDTFDSMIGDADSLASRRDAVLSAIGASTADADKVECRGSGVEMMAARARASFDTLRNKTNAALAEFGGLEGSELATIGSALDGMNSQYGAATQKLDTLKQAWSQFSMGCDTFNSTYSSAMSASSVIPSEDIALEQARQAAYYAGATADNIDSIVGMVKALKKGVFGAGLTCLFEIKASGWYRIIKGFQSGQFKIAAKSVYQALYDGLSGYYKQGAEALRGKSGFNKMFASVMENTVNNFKKSGFWLGSKGLKPLGDFKAGQFDDYLKGLKGSIKSFKFTGFIDDVWGTFKQGKSLIVNQRSLNLSSVSHTAANIRSATKFTKGFTKALPVIGGVIDFGITSFDAADAFMSTKGDFGAKAAAAGKSVGKNVVKIVASSVAIGVAASIPVAGPIIAPFAGVAASWFAEKVMDGSVQRFAKNPGKYMRDWKNDAKKTLNSVSDSLKRGGEAFVRGMTTPQPSVVMGGYY